MANSHRTQAKKKISSGNLTSMICKQSFCNFVVNVALSL